MFWAFTDTEVNNYVSIYPTSESVRNRPLKKTQIIKKQSRALSRSLISEYPGYSLITEPITARKKTLFTGWVYANGGYSELEQPISRATPKALITGLAYAHDGYSPKRNCK